MNGFDTTGTPAAGVITLGAARNFTVLGLNEGAGNLIINNTYKFTLPPFVFVWISVVIFSQYLVQNAIAFGALGCR